MAQYSQLQIRKIIIRRRFLPPYQIPDDINGKLTDPKQVMLKIYFFATRRFTAPLDLIDLINSFKDCYCVGASFAKEQWVVVWSFVVSVKLHCVGKLGNWLHGIPADLFKGLIRGHWPFNGEFEFQHLVDGTV